MHLDHDVHLRADGRADLLERFQPFPDLVGRDVVTATGHRVRIEGPDLHPADALLEQAVGELVGPVDERLEVLVGTWGDPARPAPLPDRGAIRRHEGFGVRSSVVVPRARVVDADPVATRSTEQLVDRLARRLAEDVPQGDVDGRVAPGLRARATVAHEQVVERSGVTIDLEGILAEQVRGDRLVDMSFHCLGAQTRLAQSHHALVGMHADPDLAGDLAETNGLETDDLHATPRGNDRLTQTCRDEAGTRSGQGEDRVHAGTRVEDEPLGKMRVVGEDLGRHPPVVLDLPEGLPHRRPVHVTRQQRDEGS